MVVDLLDWSTNQKKSPNSHATKIENVQMAHLYKSGLWANLSHKDFSF
jgi:hypothetical protein